MPVDVYWAKESQILAVDYSGDVTVDDVRTVVTQLTEFLRMHPLHFLVDLSQATSFAPEIIELSSLSEWLYHPNGRWFAYVQPSGVFKSLVRYRHRNPVKIFHDRIDALGFLEQAARP
ncbi:MAG: hypothetical protein JNJ61_14005 [Anaerolineae bacterium]|nr:hypothetical protein [Anaerolineae bacterium]